MAEQSGFFNSNVVNGNYDREYLAEDFAKYFASFVGNGIFGGKSNELLVVQSTDAGMKVDVLPGMGWINGYWYENTSKLTLNIDVADGVLNRIDSVVIRWGKAERKAWLAIAKGAPAAVAVAAAVQRTADYYELKLAEISVKAGTTKITQTEIKDTRLDSNVCGIVTGLIDQIDTTDLFAQYDAAFQTWFESIKGQLSEDAAGNLQNQINNKADKTHASTHAMEGSDPLTPADIGALSDSSGAVKTSNLADEVVTRSKLGAGSVGTAQLGESVVTAEKIAALAITAALIADKTITAAKIADKTVGAGQLADNIPYTKFGLAANQVRKITVGAAAPSGGSDGDVYIKYS